MKKISNPKKIMYISLIVLLFGTLIYGLFEFLGYDEKIKLYFVIMMGISFVCYIFSSIIKLKRNGILYDERDDYLEKEANAVSFTVFQIFLAIIVFATYNLKEVKVSISGFALILFFVMWLIYAITHLIIKRKN